MNIRRSTRVATLAAAGLLVVAAYAGPGPALAGAGPSAYEPEPLAETTTVRIGMSAPLESFLAILLADEMGEFERENIEVEINYVPTSDSTRLLTQGELDVVPTSYSAGNLNLMDATDAMRFVFPLDVPNPDRPEGLWARSDALGGDGFQPEDLRGERVLTFSGLGTPWEPFIFGQFADQGSDLTPADVAFERLGVAETAPALQGGSANFALVLSPFYEVLADDDCCEFVGLWPPYAQGMVAFGPSLLDEHPDVGAAFLRALARTSLTYLQGSYLDDPDVAPHIAEVLEIPIETLQERVSTSWDPEFAFPPESAFETTQTFYMDNDLLSYAEPMAYSSAFDRSLFEGLTTE